MFTCAQAKKNNAEWSHILDENILSKYQLDLHILIFECISIRNLYLIIFLPVLSLCELQTYYLGQRYNFAHNNQQKIDCQRYIVTVSSLHCKTGKSKNKKF